MPRNPDEKRGEQAPRTDLPPEREPYYDGYFGTEEEEGVVREEESGDEDAVTRRGASEDAAGGDTDIA
jgi:hypothetical protein